MDHGNELGVVDHGHELGERQAPKYGVVGEVEVRHIERDVHRAEVVPSAERDGQLDLPQRDGFPVGHTAERGRGGELTLPYLHPAEHLRRQQVEACSAVHQGPANPDVADGGRHDDREKAHTRRVGGVVAPVERNGSA